jgi:hypothetical protein
MVGRYIGRSAEITNLLIASVSGVKTAGTLFGFIIGTGEAIYRCKERMAKSFLASQRVSIRRE